MRHLSCYNTEVSFLGCILMNIKNLAFLTKIKKEDFCRSEHYFIFEFIDRNQEKIKDVITVIELMESQGVLDGAGGEKEIWDIANHAGVEINLLEYEKTITETSSKRKILKNIELLKNELSTPNELSIQDINSKIQSLAIPQNSSEEGKAESLLECWPKMIDHWNDKARKAYVNSGFSGLDHFLKGFKPSELVILAAKSSTGKTTFAINVALNVAKQSDVLFFSIE